MAKLSKKLSSNTLGQDVVYPAVMTALLSGVITAGEVLGRNTTLDFAALHHYLDTLSGGKDVMVDMSAITTAKEAGGGEGRVTKSLRRESIMRQTSQG